MDDLNLKILDLNNNNIEIIPNEIQYLTNLRELNLNILISAIMSLEILE